MKCNIDSKGKAVRLASGAIIVCAGASLLALAVFGITDTVWMWVLGTSLTFVGGFQVFEGWAGWCALRAMGFTTRI